MISAKIGLLGLLLMLTVACTNTADSTVTEKQDMVDDTEQQPEIEKTSWLDYELTDVNTGQNFMLSDFAGESVLVESFAVWCPTCTRQQVILSEMSGDTVHISVNTDPNEDSNKVKEHAEQNGFDWRYSVAPKEFTQSWIDEFGLGIVNAPSVPMILICEDQSYRLLDSGIKQESELEQEISRGCDV